MFGVGVPELVVILLIVLLVVGGKKLPELSKGLGQSIKELRKGMLEDVSPDADKKKKSSQKNLS